MNLGATLKKRAKDTNRKVVQGEAVEAKNHEVEKAKDSKGLAGILKKAKKTTIAKGEIDINFICGPVDKWSFSTLKNHENCPYFTKLHKIDKQPQKESEAADRGSMIHDGCEQWVRGNVADLPSDNKTKFDLLADDFMQLKKDFQAGKVEMEEQWGIRKDWSPCDWDDDELWGRAKLDAFVRENETACRIIDHKTGRKFGNEMKHSDQGLSYALAAMHRFPELETFQVEFWYIDQGEKMIRSFNRKQLLILLPRYHGRAQRMTMEERFDPNPNVHSCRFCAYGHNTNRAGTPYGTGVCEHDAYKSIEDEEAA